MIFLKIMGILLLIFVVIFLIGLTIKIGIHIFWQEKGCMVKIKLGILSVQLFPWKFRIKSKPQSKRNKKKTVRKNQKKETRLYPENLDWQETLSFVFRLLEEMRDTITVRKLYFGLVVAGPDAAKTAIRYGRIWEVVGLLEPVLDHYFRIPDKKIQIQCDFDAKKIKPDVEIYLYTRPVRTLYVLWKERKDLWKLYQKLTKEEEVKYVESSHS